MVLDERHIVFIVGVGRSGTTLLQSMLNAHPEVCFPPETHFFRLYVQNGKFEKLIRKNGADVLVEHLKADRYLERLDLDIENLLNRLLKNNQITSAHQFYLMLLHEYANRKKKWVVGDKDPRNIEFVSGLHRYFPHANIIHMIRDPRDVILSRMKADWSKNRNFIHHIFVYKVQVQIGRQIGHRLFKGRYFEVIYEELLNNPTETLSQICDFLNIPYTPKMLDFSSSAKEIINNSELQWKKEALGPLLRDNWEKWRKSLTNRQILLIEKCCREVFNESPYNFSDIQYKAGHFDRIYSKMTSILLSTLSKIYRRWRCR